MKNNNIPFQLSFLVLSCIISMSSSAGKFKLGNTKVINDYKTNRASILRDTKMGDVAKRPILRINMEEEVDIESTSEDNESNVEDVEDKPPTSNEYEEDFEKNYRYKKEKRNQRYKINKSQFFRTGYVSSESSDTYPVRRIVGGMQTQIRKYPYNVAIARHGRHWCGGSIIDEQWILTAGHCLDEGMKGDLEQYLVRAGSSFHDRSGHVANINKVFFPKRYETGDADYDISLARLDRPFPIGRNIAVINLPAESYTIHIGDILIVTGWGSTRPDGVGHIAKRLRFVPVPVISTASCQKSYAFPISPRMVCAGYATGGMDACNHDSGGPAAKDNVLLGIVSFGGKQCGDPQSPGVYTRVSVLTSWIERTITRNEANTVPELIPNIMRAKAREKELREFKLRVDKKKKNIKIWLKKALTLKHKRNDKHDFRRNNKITVEDIDDANLEQLMEDYLFGDDSNTKENIINILALQEMINSNRTV